MKQLLILVLALWSTSSIHAQAPGGPGPKPPMGEKVKQMRIAFINSRLALTEEEKNIFWPLFNKYETERKQLIKSRLGEPGEQRNFEAMSTAEINLYIDSMLEIREKEAALQRKYMTEFRKILPLPKAAKLLTIEEQFRHYLMKQAKEKMGQ